MKILVSGVRGRMGTAIVKHRGKHTIACGISRTGFEADFPVYSSFNEVTEDFDVMIDFSVNDNAQQVIRFAEKTQKPLIIGTTALSEEDEKALEKLAECVPVLYSHNTAFGVNIFMSILEFAAEKLCNDFDIEIIEKHDRNKRDAPSGTSGLLVEALEAGAGKKFSIVHGRKGKGIRSDDDLAIHSVRGGHLGSEHFVSFIGENETIEINHYTPNYDIYAIGAVRAADTLVTLPNGLYRMKEIITTALNA